MSSGIVLVTGGAGYIGSHTVRALLRAGYQPVIYDNLSSGHREAVPPEVPLEVADLADVFHLRRVLETYRPEAVIHFAAFIEAGESMVDPRRFYRNNVQNSLNLFDAMLEAGVKRLVFSSSAGVYGQPEHIPIPETERCVPVNTYGETKLIVEHILRDYDRAYGLTSISLRYFNACGADPSGEIGEAHITRTHLIELALLTALGQREAIKVFGTDYPTPDGTAIRDYIHVVDLSDAHVLALEALKNGMGTRALNVGLGRGYSVQQVLDAVDRTTGRPPIRRVLERRRAGDPAVLVADSSRIRSELSWAPRYTELEDMIATAWKWHSTHPNGFETETSQDVKQDVRQGVRQEQ